MTSKVFFRAIELLAKTSEEMQKATKGQIKDFYNGYNLAMQTVYEMSKTVDDNWKFNINTSEY